MLLFIILAPFIGFLINATFGRRLPKTVSGGVAVAAMLVAFGISLASAAQIFGAPVDGRVIEQTVFTWFTSGDFSVPFTLRLDPLATLMILVVTGIGSLIHIYSTSYMHEERDSEYARYFSYLNLFAAFMLTLVLGASFPIMFVGWEGVGLCSYLLIGFWFTKKSASDAGKKAFVVNRIGDFAFILGMFGAFVTFGTLDFKAIAEQVASMPVELTWGVLSVTTLLFFIGATGKSAQIPLFIWLPDAMEGPTPVSALIHAATMVTAGVYMIGRNAELFAHAPHTMQVVAVIGALTALMAGTIGLVQNDIKRVLAYSTVSQLGYMFLAMGVGAFSAGVFHLYTHAFFKALMFLGSGSVIHAMAGEQDMRKMGGLKKYMPITYWTFVIGAAAIAGVPGLAGFFSKDEILFQAYYTGHTGLWAIGALTGLLTACYMFRLIFMTFHGKERFEAGAPGRARRTAMHAHAATIAAADAHDCARARPSRRAARVALGDGAAAGPARGRIGRRRLRRRAARARRQQRHRDVPASELPPGSRCTAGCGWRRLRDHDWRPRRAAPRAAHVRVRAGRHAPAAGDAWRRGRARRPEEDADRADADGRVDGPGVPRHRPGGVLLPAAARRRPTPRRPAWRRCTGCC